MLRKFKISIDGKEYLVEMEEIGGTPAPAPVAPTAPVPEAPAPAAPEATPEVAPAAPVASSPAGDDAITAPMPGTILKILVEPGQTVKMNEPLLILEAMKMENEIVAPQDGVVSGIHVTTGQTVNPGDPLATVN